MRVLLIGAVLGALLGGCSFLMLEQLEDLLTMPQRVVLSIVIGLSFSGLIWSFGLVRWIATRIDQRAARRREAEVDEVDEYDDASVDFVDPLGEAEVEYDDVTGTVELSEQTWDVSLGAEVLEPPPLPPRDFDALRLPHPEPEEFDDDNTTQLVSRAELRALARAMLEGGSPDEFEPPPKLDPGQVEEMLEQAAYATDAGRFDEAVELYTQVIDSTEDPRAYLGRGRIHLDHSDYNRAMSDFRVAEELVPGAPEPLVAMGDLFFGRKDYVQSIEYLTLALGQQPDHAMALTRRGMSQYYLKDYEAALADLQRASELDPDIPMLSSYLARAERRVRGIPTSAVERRRR